MVKHISYNIEKYCFWFGKMLFLLYVLLGVLHLQGLNDSGNKFWYSLTPNMKNINVSEIVDMSLCCICADDFENNCKDIQEIYLR